MKQIQKKITIIVWCCSIIISLFSFLEDMNTSSSLRVNGMMYASCITTTIFYFLPISDRMKAIISLSLVGLASLFASVIVGGNSATFLVSFLVLGAAVLFFDPVVLIGYSAIYLTASFIVYKINPVYLVGKKIDTYLGFVMMFTYLLMSACLVIATLNGKKLITASETEEKEVQMTAEVIRKQNMTVHENSAILCEKMQVSEHTVNDLFQQVNLANDRIKNVKSSQDETIVIFHELMNVIHHSTECIEENYKLIDRLTENFNIALENVTKSKSISNHTEKSMDNIQTTIAKAYGSIVESSKETEKIKAITEDINSIASQTNLLAINASIEAARVGEAGAGFNIVAEQVRSLSVESKAASENIDKILSVLSQSLETTKEKIHRGQQAILLGMGKLSRMVQCIDMIDLYSNQSQVSLTQEVKVFEQTKKDFSDMVNEVQRAMKSAELSMENLSVVADAIETQTNRTNQISNQLREIKMLSNQLLNEDKEASDFAT